MDLKNPYLLIGAGAPLALSAVAPASTENVRRAAGVTALVSGAVYFYSGSRVAGSVAVGTGAAWAVMRLGIL